jgi:hypothetical protein
VRAIFGGADRTPGRVDPKNGISATETQRHRENHRVIANVLKSGKMKGKQNKICLSL